MKRIELVLLCIGDVYNVIMDVMIKICRMR